MSIFLIVRIWELWVWGKGAGGVSGQGPMGHGGGHGGPQGEQGDLLGSHWGNMPYLVRFQIALVQHHRVTVRTAFRGIT